MPNWCENSVKLTHQDPAMIKRVEDAFNQERLFDEFTPTPKELNYPEGFEEGYSDELVLRWEEQKKSNLEKYGYSDWYGFHIAEWGTKWEAETDKEYITTDGNRADLYFRTAWSPPIPFYSKLLQLGFQIEAYYYGEGNDFAGKWIDGESTEYEITDFNSVPDEIVDAFGIEPEDFGEDNLEKIRVIFTNDVELLRRVAQESNRPFCVEVSLSELIEACKKTSVGE